MVTILTGDCREVLRTLPDASVHCCVTSPPYWGLRDYGTATWEAGDPECKHAREQVDPKTGHAESIGGNDRRRGRHVCHRCGARRIDSQLGLERTPEEYVDNLVAVFREVRHVLRDDGTLWLNLGDSYSAKPCSDGSDFDDGRANRGKRHSGGEVAGLKPKDLVGIPWRVAFALQADGWYLRSDIIWAKPNPMPESVKDRPTKSHEHIFLLAKSATYYYDAEAIAEPACDPPREQRKTGANAFRGQAALRPRASDAGRRKANDGFRNKRDVWTVPTAQSKIAHFATFPPALILPCILAGCPPGGTVLDPFGGSGTTGEVASGNGRSAVVCELNPDYAALAQARCGLFCGA